MIEPLLKTRLEPIAQRQRRLKLWRGLAICFGAAAAAGFLLFLFSRSVGVGLPFSGPLLALATLVGVIWVAKRVTSWEPDFRGIARQIEQHHPDLHELLLTAVEQRPDPKTGELNFLQERVIEEALAESQKQQWVETVSDRQLFWMRGAFLAALLAFLGVLAKVAVSLPLGRSVALQHSQQVDVSPGDTTLERGSGLVVLAKFDRPPNKDVTLVARSATGEAVRVPLVKNLDDPIFGGRLAEVNSELTYHVEFSGEQTRDFKVKVFEYPSLLRADAQLTFPEYTGLSEKRIEETHRVSAVEGSNLEYIFQLNKPVTSAKLIGKDNTTLALEPDQTRSNIYIAKFTLEKSQRYELRLVDDEGRTNRVPSQFDIDVLKNRTPELKLAFPRGDQRVSPLEEIAFEGEALDDFGLRAYGLATRMAGKEAQFVELGQEAPGNEKRRLTHLLPLEELSVEPNQLVTYFLWADDVGPDGKVRRSFGDMYFAEVKPFEEIFREGQSQESESEGGQASESDQLAELQKQIINATWKLQRQETGKSPTPQYKKDATVIEESQNKALEQLGQLKQRIQDPQMQTFAEQAEKEMEKAAEHLSSAAGKNSVEPLPNALTAEQSAYQALLRLQAKEYQVSQNRSRSRSGASQRAQRELDQLELKQAEDRYETARQAQKQQSPEQREQLQVLNRLKELAQRQQDLNERLKELQTALQEAKTEEEKEALRRQLKRLREEEQQMLADLDELNQKMAQSQNQSQMAEARKQLEQTRSDIRKAAEELEKGGVSQALASGTRAQRDLQQLRDDFRKKTSTQFAEEMRQMRADARELAEKQNEISKKLDALAESKRKTLSDSGERKELTDQLQQQKSGMTNIVQNMRQVTEQAEASEPLLSKQLYDTLRKTDQARIDDKLGQTSQLLERGFVPQAGEAEKQAGVGINELKEGVERAAESVLGDEMEALRLARSQLDELTQQLEREIAANGNSDGSTNQMASGENGPGDRQQQTAQQGQSGRRGQREGQQGEEGEAQGEGREGQGSDRNQQTAQAGQGGEGQQAQAERSAQAQRGSRGQQGEGQGEAGQEQNQEPTATAQNQGQQGRSEQRAQGQGQGQGEGGQEQNQEPTATAQNQGQQGSSGQRTQGQGQGQGEGQPTEGQQPGTQAQPTASAQANARQPGPGEGQGQGEGQQPGQANGQAANEQRNNGRGSGVRPTDRQAQQRAQAGRGVAGEQPGRRFFDDMGGPVEEGGPLTGENFTDWAEGLGEVEEMLDVPQLRNDIARAREQARAVRMEYKRHGKEPQWRVVRGQILGPLLEVRKGISEELARRENKDSLVPIDRDPVPPQYSEKVKRYYEQLGSSN
jgi:hypothetical protein